jgi:hypothetical protein
VHALLLADTLEIGAHEFLELVDFDRKAFRLKQPHVLDVVDHDLRRRGAARKEWRAWTTTRPVRRGWKAWIMASKSLPPFLRVGKINS